MSDSRTEEKGSQERPDSASEDSAHHWRSRPIGSAITAFLMVSAVLVPFGGAVRDYSKSSGKEMQPIGWALLPAAAAVAASFSLAWLALSLVEIAVQRGRLRTAQALCTGWSITTIGIFIVGTVLEFGYSEFIGSLCFSCSFATSAGFLRASVFRWELLPGLRELWPFRNWEVL